MTFTDLMHSLTFTITSFKNSVRNSKTTLLAPSPLILFTRMPESSMDLYQNIMVFVSKTCVIDINGSTKRKSGREINLKTCPQIHRPFVKLIFKNMNLLFYMVSYQSAHAPFNRLISLTPGKIVNAQNRSEDSQVFVLSNKTF